MTPDQTIVLGVLLVSMALFMLERWRYDVVALIALITLALLGIVPAGEVFSGFGHPAVITVAAVLIVSRGLANSGVVDRLSRLLHGVGPSTVGQVAALTVVVTVCSAFMNNVGALALLMPVALRLGQRNGTSPSLLLMPLAFGSLLGGMTTLIGTPPNIIIGTYRAEVTGEPFRLFDYAPVGLVVAVVGLFFLAFLGWRLIPDRKSQDPIGEVFHIEEYTTELRIPEGSPWIGKLLRDLRPSDVGEIVVVAIQRGEERLLAPARFERLRAGDLLIAEIDPERLEALVEATGFELVGGADAGAELMRSEEVTLAEAVVLPRSPLQRRTAEEIHLRTRFNVNLLAVARQGSRLRRQLKGIRFQPGDVLLLQCLREDLERTLGAMGCVPLAQRDLRLSFRRRTLPALAIFASAIVALLLGALPAATAFAAAALVMVLTRIVSLNEAYRSLDLPVIVLLAAMIPVGGALESTGGAALIAEKLLWLGDYLPVYLTLGVLLVLTMFLSDLMNNAATAVIMAPIAVGLAEGVGASPDPFLMAVAVGASCAFLTPIGHQSNTLVMGPGGYRFGDYWRMGLPLELLIAALAVPMILWVWPV